MKKRKKKNGKTLRGECFLGFDPEKFRKEKEREISATYSAMRKRSFKFLFLNVLIVLAVFSFLFFVRNVSPQTYSNIVDTFQLTIEIPKPEYTAPEKIGARVYIVNTKRVEKNFVISDFYFKIYNNSKTIYEFSYSNPVQGSVQAQGRRLVFNLEENVFLANLPGGTYTIYARCKINGKVAEISRSLIYKEEILYGILSEPYYLVGEEFQPSVYIINRTIHPVDIALAKIIWSYKGNEFQQYVNENVKLYPGESHAFKASTKFKAETEGIEEINAKLYFQDGTIKEFKSAIPIAKNPEFSPKDIDFNIESEEPVVVGKIPVIKVYLVNKMSKERFLKIDKIQFSIAKIGYNFEINNRRVYCIPFGRSFITKLEKLSFTEPGVYDLIITFVSGSSKIEKKVPLAVAK